jgi:hypothetical protein
VMPKPTSQSAKRFRSPVKLWNGNRPRYRASLGLPDREVAVEGAR